MLHGNWNVMFPDAQKNISAPLHVDYNFGNADGVGARLDVPDRSGAGGPCWMQLNARFTPGQMTGSITTAFNICVAQETKRTFPVTLTKQ